MNDSVSTINILKQEVQAFIDERDWQQFHSPKNIAMSIAIESAELMELFQWDTTEQSNDALRNEELRNEIKHELADIFSYVLDMAHVLHIDISESLMDKLQKNREKYPIELCKGRSVKYTKLRKGTYNSSGDTEL